jgi:hypothetical protein
MDYGLGDQSIDIKTALLLKIKKLVIGLQNKM